MRVFHYWLLALTIIFFSSITHAFDPKRDSLGIDDSLPKKRYKIIAIPLFFYVPETKFGGGAAGVFTFHPKKASLTSRPSSIQFGVAITQLKQTLIYLPFNLWLNNEAINAFGEIGYYKYNYFFWGVGNQQDFSLMERYDVKYPRIKLSVLKRVIPNLYTGIRYNFDNFKITQIDTSGLLSKGNILGSKGGIVSSLGIVTKFDSRDNQFSPTKGHLAEIAYQFDDKSIGSSFNNTRLSFDAASYLTFKTRHTVAFNVMGIFGNGSIPFNQLAFLGGPKKMRGFYEGRYRDKKLLLFQTEYRVNIYKRFGAVAFISAGDVARAVKQFNLAEFKVAYGAGLRMMLDKQQKINIRLDIGWADPKPNFYLTITEAF